MRRISAALIALAAAMVTANMDSNACTNVLVTKGASTDGSNMVSYAADSHQLYGELYYLKSASPKEQYQYSATVGLRYRFKNK